MLESLGKFHFLKIPYAPTTNKRICRGHNMPPMANRVNIPLEIPHFKMFKLRFYTEVMHSFIDYLIIYLLLF